MREKAGGGAAEKLQVEAEAAWAAGPSDLGFALPWHGTGVSTGAVCSGAGDCGVEVRGH